jgi:hypothetical protein
MLKYATENTKHIYSKTKFTHELSIVWILQKSKISYNIYPATFRVQETRHREKRKLSDDHTMGAS